jgi:hypothetical protein
MAVLLPAWVRQSPSRFLSWLDTSRRISTQCQTYTDPLTVDLGGSLAVASRGLFATGVSTDLNVTYLSSGGKIGDLIKAEVTCDKCTPSQSIFVMQPSANEMYSWQDVSVHVDQLFKQQRRGVCQRKSHEIRSAGLEGSKQYC